MFQITTKKLLFKLTISLFTPTFLFLFTGCLDSSDDNKSKSNSSTFTLTNSEISGVINSDLVCTEQGGKNESPALDWSNHGLQNVVEWAIVMDDEVDPCGTGDDACKHWSVYNISADVTSIARNTLPAGVSQGKTYADTNRYEGPCPPSKHTYKLTVYGLDAGIQSVSEGQTRSQFEKVYADQIIDKATSTGTYTP